MSEQLRESISALMDGEAQELEVRRLLSEDNFETVRTEWSRYHLLRDTMRGDSDSVRFKGLDISTRVSLAIDGDESPAVSQKSFSAWLKPAGGFAVAASVAMAIVVGVQSVNPGSSTLSPTDTLANTPIAASRVYTPLNTANTVSYSTPAASTVTVAPRSVMPVELTVSQLIADLEAQKRLDKYILRHTEKAALNNSKGMVSYARVVSFEGDKLENK